VDGKITATTQKDTRKFSTLCCNAKTHAVFFHFFLFIFGTSQLRQLHLLQLLSSTDHSTAAACYMQLLSRYLQLVLIAGYCNSCSAGYY
jgi:hypothetical protein